MKILNLKKFTPLFLPIFFLLAIIFPNFAEASVEIGINLENEIVAGKDFIATVYINVDDPINAIEGALVFPESLVRVKSVSDGNSVINLWVERPKVSGGTISFSGITPGGLTSKGGQVFSVVFSPKNNFNITDIKLRNIRAFANDGRGAEVDTTLLETVVGQVEYSIRGQSINRGIGDSDIEPPELFNIEFVRNQSIFKNNWFLVFATQDKNSGINRYEVKEFRHKALSFLARYKQVESPHVVSDQKRKSYIYVKAVDNAGNERVVSLYPLNTLAWYEKVHYQAIIIVLLVSLFVVIRKLWKKQD